MGKQPANQILTRAAVHTPAIGSGRKGLKRLKSAIMKGQAALTRPSVRRLARRAGVKRISAGIYDEAPTALRTWLSKIVGDACVFTEHAKRFTVTLNDILMSLKRNGVTLYGFDIVERRRRLTRPVSKEALTTAAQRVAARNATKQQRTRRTTAPAMAAAAAPEGLAPIEVEERVIVNDKENAEDEQAAQLNSTTKAHKTPEKLDAIAAPTSSPAVVDVSPERAQEIQTSLGAFRDTVVVRQTGSDAKVTRILDWVSSHLRGRGLRPCSGGELEVVLDVLAERDAVMLTEDESNGGRVVWFV